ncbi:MAG: endonuclease III [Candidatus Neomarinimicrobiota bacterium]|jgi:endonuclease-3|nr:endonuclease III [Candidatus Neomarinimicrobiota bacterium]MDD4961382.1 endonuclease III [Candidatus Neomarinimicrobiota bacterium]MDD5709476.1 endonuclease III [Candidatus Neomarinimicrobiota bacterium]MDX9780225.1 endonuclease III [bacterium]
METLDQKKVRAGRITRELEQMYPEIRCELDHDDAYELLVATILSAQCTDARVNRVTPQLFRHFPDIASMANADPEKLIADIRSTGFFNNKSKNLIACCKALMERFDGKIPGKIEDLTSLPGVGRKTANVILNHIYHVPAIVVDTHVARISRHLGLSEETDPVKIEFELQTILPEDKWIAWNHQLIRHGRSICIARRPKCTKCRLRPLCPGPYEA